MTLQGLEQAKKDVEGYFRRGNRASADTSDMRMNFLIELLMKIFDSSEKNKRGEEHYGTGEDTRGK